MSYVGKIRARYFPLREGSQIHIQLDNSIGNMHIWAMAVVNKIIMKDSTDWFVLFFFW